MEDLTEEQSIEFQEAFKKFDTEHKDAIPTTSFSPLMEAFGIHLTDADYERMIEALDPEGVGTITLTKFLELMGNKLKPSTDLNEVRAAFKQFDHKKNGIVSTKEFLHAVRTFCSNILMPEEMEKLIQEADSGKTGNVDYERFIQLLISK